VPPRGASVRPTSVPVRRVLGVRYYHAPHLPPAACRQAASRPRRAASRPGGTRSESPRPEGREACPLQQPCPCVCTSTALNTGLGRPQTPPAWPSKGPRSETERAVSSSTQLLRPVDAGEPTGGQPDPSFGSVLRPYICYNRSYFVGGVGWTGMSTTGSVPAHCVPSENSTAST